MGRKLSWEKRLFNGPIDSEITMERKNKSFKLRKLQKSSSFADFSGRSVSFTGEIILEDKSTRRLFVIF